MRARSLLALEPKRYGHTHAHAHTYTHSFDNDSRVRGHTARAKKREEARAHAHTHTHTHTLFDNDSRVRGHTARAKKREEARSLRRRPRSSKRRHRCPHVCTLPPWRICNHANPDWQARPARGAVARRGEEYARFPRESKIEAARDASLRMRTALGGLQHLSSSPPSSSSTSSVALALSPTPPPFPRPHPPFPRPLPPGLK